MNKGGFSWKRASGISAAKSRISRATGVPLSRTGRQAKIGRVISGGGCMLPLLMAMLLVLLLGCGAPSTPTPSTSSTQPAAVDLAPGEGTTMADAAFNEVKPVADEQVAFLGDESDTTMYLMDRLMAASDAHEDWQLSGEKMGIGDGELRSMPYRFADNSVIIVRAVPRDGENQGLKLQSVEITR